MSALRLLIRQEQMSKPDFGPSEARDLVQICRENVLNLKSYLRIAAQNIDRYFIATYLTALIVPLGCIIVRETSSESLRQEALGAWWDALHLLEDISRNFGVAQMLLRRFATVIKSVISATSTHTNSIGAFDWCTLSGSASGRRLANEGQAREIGDNENANSAGVDGDTSVHPDSLAGFPPMHFHGLASDPDLWRITTW